MSFLIFHGIVVYAEENWMSWLACELGKEKHSIIMPTLPNSDRPDRFVWLETIQQYVSTISANELVIVGHSLGVPSTLDYLETVDEPIHVLISVSGFHKAYGAEMNDYFMSAKDISLEQAKKQCNHFAVLYGDNDPYVPQDVLQDFAESLSVTPHVINQGGHLGSSAGYDEFPLLLDVINEIL